MRRLGSKMFIAVAMPLTLLALASGADAVQVPVEFSPLEPIGQVHAGFGEIQQVRAEVPFTLRAYPRDLGSPATYSWEIDGSPGGWCSTSPTTAPEITITLPAGHYEIGICVTEEDGGGTHCREELDVVPPGPIAAFKLSGPPELDLQTFREQGATIPVSWGRPVDTTYRAEILANFDGRSTHSYPLQFTSRGRRRSRITSDSERLSLRISAPVPNSPVGKLLRRAERHPHENIGTQIFIKPDITGDPAWGGLQDEFEFGAMVDLYAY